MRLLPLALGAAVCAAVVGYGVRGTGNSLTDAHQRVEALHDAATSVAVAHLWLEEAVAGDPVDLDREVFARIDQATWTIDTLLAGGALPTGARIDAAPRAIRPALVGLDEKLARLHRVAVERTAGTPRVGSDQEYATLFPDVTASFDDLEAAVRAGADADAAASRLR